MTKHNFVEQTDESLGLFFIITAVISQPKDFRPDIAIPGRDEVIEGS